jgi:hypothetical protein
MPYPMPDGKLILADESCLRHVLPRERWHPSCGGPTGDVRLGGSEPECQAPSGLVKSTAEICDRSRLAKREGSPVETPLSATCLVPWSDHEMLRLVDLRIVGVASTPTGVAGIERLWIGATFSHVLAVRLHDEIGRTIDEVIQPGKDTDRVRMRDVFGRTGIRDAPRRADHFSGVSSARANTHRGHTDGNHKKCPSPFHTLPPRSAAD